MTLINLAFIYYKIWVYKPAFALFNNALFVGLDAMVRIIFFTIYVNVCNQLSLLKYLLMYVKNTYLLILF